MRGKTSPPTVKLKWDVSLLLGPGLYSMSTWHKQSQSDVTSGPGTLEGLQQSTLSPPQISPPYLYLKPNISKFVTVKIPSQLVSLLHFLYITLFNFHEQFSVGIISDFRIMKLSSETFCKEDRSKLAKQMFDHLLNFQ